MKLQEVSLWPQVQQIYAGAAVWPSLALLETQSDHFCIMVNAPSQLLWELVKDWNCYQRKGPQNRAIFSSEPGNLYNKHCYKHSGQYRLGLKSCHRSADHVLAEHWLRSAGLANPKNFHIAEGAEGKISMSKGRKHTSHSKKQFPRLASSVQKETKSYRPDLQVLCSWLSIVGPHLLAVVLISPRIVCCRNLPWHD